MNNFNWKGDEVLKKVQEATQGKMKDFVENITEISKQDSPHLTGTNASSVTWDTDTAPIKVIKEGESAQPGSRELKPDSKFRVYTSSGYGFFLEVGTSKMAARAYIYPAYEQSKEEFKDTLRNIL